MKRSRHPEKNAEKRPKRVATGMTLSEFAKKRVAEKRDASESIAAAAGAFFEASTSTPTEIMDASCSWDTRVCESFLVARLGLAGAEGLRLAHNLLPKQYGSTRRNQLAAAIVNSFIASGSSDAVSETECGVLLSFIEERCVAYCNLQTSDHLRRLSREKGFSFKEFLAPPVSTCINSVCKGRLVDQHKPIAVTIFGLTGPRKATKLSLRCSTCNTVYNYSQYGRRHTIGERWYEQRREYIEVSDTVYCERLLHELFCNLRYCVFYMHACITAMGLLKEVCMYISSV